MHVCMSLRWCTCTCCGDWTLNALAAASFDSIAEATEGVLPSCRSTAFRVEPGPACFADCPELWGAKGDGGSLTPSIRLEMVMLEPILRQGQGRTAAAVTCKPFCLRALKLYEGAVPRHPRSGFPVGDIRGDLIPRGMRAARGYTLSMRCLWTSARNLKDTFAKDCIPQPPHMLNANGSLVPGQQFTGVHVSFARLSARWEWLREDDESKDRWCVQQLGGSRAVTHQDASRALQKPNPDLVRGLPADSWPGCLRCTVHQQLRQARVPNDGRCKWRAGCTFGSLSTGQ